MKSIKPFNLIYSFILFFFLHISYAHIENTHDHEREKWFFQDSSGPFIAEFIFSPLLNPESLGIIVTFSSFISSSAN